MRSERLTRVIAALAEALYEKHFAELIPLMGDDFTELRGRLQSHVKTVGERAFKAFVARSFTDAQEIQILQSNDLVHFPEIERDLDELINHLQHLRLAGG